MTDIAKVLDELVDQGMGAIFLIDSLVDRNGRPSVGPVGPTAAREVVTFARGDRVEAAARRRVRAGRDHRRTGRAASRALRPPPAVRRWTPT